MADTQAQGSRPPEWDEIVDQAVRRIVTALIIVGAFIALAIYMRPGPPRFEAVAADGKLFRVDTKTGTVLACEENRCMTVVRRGQHLERSLTIGIEREKDVPAVAPPAAKAPAAPPAPAPKQS